MVSKTQLEKNTINGFRLAKNDILKLQKGLTSLAERQEDLLKILSEVRERVAELEKRKTTTN